MKIRYFIYIAIYLLILGIFYMPISGSLTVNNEEGFVRTYFCDEINCSYFLNTFLNNSENAVCALYDLNEKSIVKTIRRNNVTVKLFNKNYEYSMPENVVAVRSKGLMHNKFCVNNDYVLTGSWNPTERGTYKNNNYIIFLKSKILANNYLKAYESLEKNQKAKALEVNLSGILIENYFCPAHNCEEEVLSEINDAKNSILVLAFSFTSKPIAKKLVELNKSGINVKALFEKTRIASYSQYDYLNKSGILVYKDTNPYTMHEKVFVIDGKTVILGSYNPTAAANTKNDENILIIHDKDIANLFVEEFNQLNIENIKSK